VERLILSAKLFKSGFVHAMAWSSRGVARVVADSLPLRETLRTAAINACTPGNVVLLIVVGLAITLGLAVITSDPIETHSAAVPPASVSPLESGVNQSKAAVSALATAGLSTGRGGLDQGGLTSLVSDSGTALLVPDHRIQPDSNENFAAPHGDASLGGMDGRAAIATEATPSGK